MGFPFPSPSAHPSLSCVCRSPAFLSYWPRRLGMQTTFGASKCSCQQNTLRTWGTAVSALGGSWGTEGPYTPVVRASNCPHPGLETMGLETVMESNMGPKPVRNDFFQKWVQTLWEGQTDLSGPFWARFDQFYGYTGYRIPNTGPRYTGQRAGAFQHGPKTSQKRLVSEVAPDPLGV